MWLSVAISGTGDGMFLTAFPLLAAVLTRDPLLIAGVTIASRLPWLLFSLPIGAIADRMDRRRLMVWADLVRCVIVAGLGVAVVMDDASIWLLYVCAFTLGLGETLHTNTSQAILPLLVERSELLHANARLNSMQTATGQFIGPPIGSALFNAAASVPFFADAVSFAGSAALLAALADVHDPRPSTTRIWADIREGLTFMRHNAALRRLALLLGLLNFFYFAAAALFILYTTERLESGKLVYTLLFVAAACGTMFSRWIVTPLNRRFGFVTAATIAFWMWAIAMSGLAFTRTPVVAIGLFFGIGIGNGLWNVLNVTLRQTLTPNRLLGRVSAIYRMVSWGIIPFAAAFGGILAKIIGLQGTFIVAAVPYVIVAVLGPVVLRPTRGLPAA